MRIGTEAHSNDATLTNVESARVPNGTEVESARVPNGIESTRAPSSVESTLLSSGIERADTLLAPVAQALRLWRRAGLELGEVAVYTDGHPLADLVGLIALWHGATPVVRVTDRELTQSADDEIVDVRNAAAAVERLRSVSANAGGFAAVDLAGQGRAIAVLLEALPRWGRLVLATSPVEPFTTAFYTDIHRKGARVCAGDLDSIFADPRAWEPEMRNARRLLADPARAAALRACVAPAGVASWIGASASAVSESAAPAGIVSEGAAPGMDTPGTAGSRMNRAVTAGTGA